MFITFEDFLNVEIYLLLPFFGKTFGHASLAGVVWAVGLKRSDWAVSPGTVCCDSVTSPRGSPGLPLLLFFPLFLHLPSVISSFFAV